MVLSDPAGGAQPEAPWQDPPIFTIQKDEIEMIKIEWETHPSDHLTQKYCSEKLRWSPERKIIDECATRMHTELDVDVFKQKRF